MLVRLLLVGGHAAVVGLTRPPSTVTFTCLASVLLVRFLLLVGAAAAVVALTHFPSAVTFTGPAHQSCWYDGCCWLVVVVVLLLLFLNSASAVSFTPPDLRAAETLFGAEASFRAFYLSVLLWWWFMFLVVPILSLTTVRYFIFHLIKAFCEVELVPSPEADDVAVTSAQSLMPCRDR